MSQNRLEETIEKNATKSIALGTADEDETWESHLLRSAKNTKQMYRCGTNKNEKWNMVEHLQPVRGEAAKNKESQGNYTAEIASDKEFVPIIYNVSTYKSQLLGLGRNDLGQLGLDPDEKNVPRPELVKSSELLKSVKSGRLHSLALTESGKVFQFGFINGKKIPVPTYVTELVDNVVAIECGQWHSVALTRDKRVYTWGCNKWGQLGLGEHNKKADRPIQVKLSIPVKSIAVGYWHSLFLTEIGEIFGCGRNEVGQVDCNSTEDKVSDLRQISGTKRFKTIRANQRFSVGFTNTGDRHCWGIINDEIDQFKSELTRLINDEFFEIYEKLINIERDQAVQVKTTTKILTKSIESNNKSNSLKKMEKNKEKIDYDKELKTFEQNQVIDKESSERNSKLVKSRLITGKQLDSNNYLVKTVHMLVIDDVTKTQPNYTLILTKIKFVIIRLALLFALKMKFPVKKFKFCPISSDSKLKNNENSDIYLKIKDNNETICFRNLEKQTNLECLSKLTQFANSQGHIYHSNYLQSLFKSGQFDQSSLEPSLYFHESGQTFLIVYFDEILVFGNSDHVEKFLQKHAVWFNDLGEITEKNPQEFCNVTIHPGNSQQFRLNQHDFIDQLLAENKDVLDEFSRKGNGKTSISSDNISLDKPSQPNSNNPVGSVVSQLDHIANTTRPDLMPCTNFLMRNIQNNSKTMWDNTVQVLQKLKQMNQSTGDCLEICNINFPLEIFVDSSLENANIDKHTCNINKCSSAIVVRWHGCVIRRKSLIQTYKSGSNIKAKQYATINGVKYGYGIAQLIQQFENFATKTRNKKAIALDCRYLSQTPPSPSLTRSPMFTVQCNYDENFEFFDDTIGNKELQNFIQWHLWRKTFRQNNKPHPNLATNLISSK